MILQTTGKWERGQSCIEVEVKDFGWVPAPLTKDASAEAVKEYMIKMLGMKAA